MPSCPVKPYRCLQSTMRSCVWVLLVNCVMRRACPRISAYVSYTRVITWCDVWSYFRLFFFFFFRATEWLTECEWPGASHSVSENDNWLIARAQSVTGEWPSGVQLQSWRSWYIASRVSTLFLRDLYIKYFTIALYPQHFLPSVFFTILQSNSLLLSHCTFPKSVLSKLVLHLLSHNRSPNYNQIATPIWPSAPRHRRASSQ